MLIFLEDFRPDKSRNPYLMGCTVNRLEEATGSIWKSHLNPQHKTHCLFPVTPSRIILLVLSLIELYSF